MQVSLKVAYQRAEELLRHGQVDDALKIYISIVNQQPDNDQAMFGMGACAVQAGDFGLAVNFFRRAFEINNNNLSALMNLAPALRRCLQYQKALEIHEMADELIQATALDPKVKAQVRADNLANWAGCYINEGTPEKALELARKALELAPDHPHGSNHAALALLEMGRWSEAYPHWEKRMGRPNAQVRDFGVPYWDGKETDVLAIHGEQGVGDEVMFASCIEEAKAIAKQVVIECEGRLVKTFARSFGVPCYPSPEALMSEWRGKLTAKCPLGSLFAHFRPSPEACPGTPYLKANEGVRAHYRQWLDQFGPGLKIGVAWRGGTPQTHAHVRGIPLQLWAPILNTPNTFVSIQYGDDLTAEAEMHRVHHWVGANSDLERQIALIDACDLIITTCQSTAHFAGALGKETMVLVPSKPRWCYGQAGAALPLYRSVTLFRQDGQDWAPAIMGVATRLNLPQLREVA